MKKPTKPLVTVWPIDNGLCFGKNWKRLPNSAYIHSFASQIYLYCDLEESAKRGAEMIERLPQSEFAVARKNIPQEWLEPGDAADLDVLFNELQRRQHSVVKLVLENALAMRAYLKQVV